MSLTCKFTIPRARQQDKAIIWFTGLAPLDIHRTTGMLELTTSAISPMAKWLAEAVRDSK